MSAPVSRYENNAGTKQQNTLALKEELGMKVATQITKVKTWLSKGMAMQQPLRILGGLVVGGVLLTMTALQFAPTSTNEASHEGLEARGVTSTVVEEYDLRFNDIDPIQARLEVREATAPVFEDYDLRFNDA